MNTLDAVTNELILRESVQSKGIHATQDFDISNAINFAQRIDEPTAVAALVEKSGFLNATRARTNILAHRIFASMRSRHSESVETRSMQTILKEYSLSTKEGVALMCLAEALLRIPDKNTRDVLIRDKVAKGEWQFYLGTGSSLFANAVSWGLLITGKLASTRSEHGLSATLSKLILKGGEPLIRKGLEMVIRVLGDQFLTGETIYEALIKAPKREEAGFRYSYGMLGEGALTDGDAVRYLESYEQAIHAVGTASNGLGIYEGPGVSIKLSALHPRYNRAQLYRVDAELYPRLLKLFILAKKYDIGLNIDAEESDRLVISLGLLEQLCAEPLLRGWDGIGFTLQAYQKCCPYVIDYLVELARRTNHRIMLRLVKGAYWGNEIKCAQLAGLEGYPVYTRKAHTDLSYLVCANKLLSAVDAIYPQFATHNAHSVAAIYEMAGRNFYSGQFEFQCLYGMGEHLYWHVVGKISDGKLNRPCRIYAPVGKHAALSVYLVQRLLENGTNASFNQRVTNERVSIEVVMEDPLVTINKSMIAEGGLGLPNNKINLPIMLYGKNRSNSKGLDLSNEFVISKISEINKANMHACWESMPVIDGFSTKSPTQLLLNPADRYHVIGMTVDADKLEVERAITLSVSGFQIWSRTEPLKRALILEHAADVMEAQTLSLINLLVREVGKTYASAVDEVRESIDYLRFYSMQVKSHFNNDRHVPLGPVVCISPWNFPLAIFTGQIAAALAAGNTVIAKPAEQSPLIAYEAVRLLHSAGVPKEALQFLPGKGSVIGAALVNDNRIRGVIFTGSNKVAKVISYQINDRIDNEGRFIPFIAETSGQNAMLVDSSAIPEQVVNDVITSAFDSAGQRCSSLRILCLQDEIAEPVLHMLKGAMAELSVGNPLLLSTDIGPVINMNSKKFILNHIQSFREKGCKVFQACSQTMLDDLKGEYIAPTIIELSLLSQLQSEVLGPVLHVLRYSRQELSLLLKQINDLGYGLALGLHTRIDETIFQVIDQAKVGNLYVNRKVIGATVGVQPFGGEGRSGTGPKAGGPLYIYRLLSRRPIDDPCFALSTLGCTVKPEDTVRRTFISDVTDFQSWCVSHGHHSLISICENFARTTPSGITCIMPGPTGEQNLYTTLPRETVFCVADNVEATLTQMAAILAVGGIGLLNRQFEDLWKVLPISLRNRFKIIDDWHIEYFDAVLYYGDIAKAVELRKEIDESFDEIISLTLHSDCNQIPLERLIVERSVSINTTAAGCNYSLLNID